MNNEFIEKLIATIDLSTETGIEEDVKGFFRNDETVKAYHLSSSQNQRYKLNITLQNSSEFEKERIFFSFMKFMRYSGINIYMKTDNNCSDGYIYLSTTKYLKGFYFEVYFQS